MLTLSYIVSIVMLYVVTTLIVTNMWVGIFCYSIETIYAIKTWDYATNPEEEE